MPIRVIVREEVFICGLSEEVKEWFKKENTFRNPKRDQYLRMFKGYLEPGKEEMIEDARKRAAFRAKKRGIEWNLKKIPEFVSLWREKDGWLALPRGYFDVVQDKLITEGMEYRVEECFPEVPAMEQVIVETGEMYDFQEPAIDAVMKVNNGVVQAPTGSGKTNMLLSLAARVQVPTLIVVHTKFLLKQTIERCRAWLGYEPGVLGGGNKVVRDITIATVATLTRMKIDKNHKLYNRFGCVITDECHHIAAATWADLMRRLPCKLKYGFSATAWRKDKMEFLIWRMIGPIVANVTFKEVEDAGKIMWPQIRIIPTNYFFDMQDDPSRWGAMITNLAIDEPRNMFISMDVRKIMAKYPDSKVLILTDRIEQAERLSEIMADLNPALLHGELKKLEKQLSMDRVISGANLTIATFHLLGEGIDVPGWDLLFLASPVAGGPRTIQMVGRVARAAPGKDRAILFDFVDTQIPMLKNASYSRARLYRTKGEK